MTNKINISIIQDDKYWLVAGDEKDTSLLINAIKKEEIRYTDIITIKEILSLPKPVVNVFSTIPPITVADLKNSIEFIDKKVYAKILYPNIDYKFFIQLVYDITSIKPLAVHDREGVVILTHKERNLLYKSQMIRMLDVRKNQIMYTPIYPFTNRSVLAKLDELYKNKLQLITEFVV